MYNLIPWMINATPISAAAKIGLSMDNPPRANEIIPKITINIEAILDVWVSEIRPIIPAKINMIPIMQNWNPKRNDTASILNVNSNPNMMAKIPITILLAVNPANINAIPKNSKLTPIIMETTPELKIGKIIKINPKIIDNIPDILFGSMFFPP